MNVLADAIIRYLDWRDRTYEWKRERKQKAIQRTQRKTGRNPVQDRGNHFPDETVRVEDRTIGVQDLRTSITFQCEGVTKRLKFGSPALTGTELVAALFPKKSG